MMKTQQENVKAPDEKKNDGQRLQALILEQVMHRLGQPKGDIRVQVRKLWEDRYRVNIFTGLESGSAALAHSFFLVTDDTGAIVAATPRITKQY